MVINSTFFAIFLRNVVIKVYVRVYDYNYKFVMQGLQWQTGDVVELGGTMDR